MRISDWSSDVCSSDLSLAFRHRMRTESFTAEYSVYLLLTCRVSTLNGSISNAASHAGKSSGVICTFPTHAASPPIWTVQRSEELRVGKECVGTCSSTL